MMAVPLMVLYEFSIIGARILTRKPAESDADGAPEPQKKE